MKTFTTILTLPKIILIGIILFCFAARADEVLTRDERIIALTLLGEARGEGKRGLFAVGCVIQRRSWGNNPKSIEIKKTPAQICLKKHQFHIWTDWEQGIYRQKKERELYYLWDSKEMMYARQLARALNNDKFVLIDTTGGANHYCHIKSNPYWAKGEKPTKIIGNHKFYKLGHQSPEKILDKPSRIMVR